MPGVKHVLQVGDGAVAVVADTWWQRQQGARCRLHQLRREPQHQGLQRDDCRRAEGWIGRHRKYRGRQQGRRCRSSDRGRGEEDRGRLHHAEPASRHHGADELHGKVDGGEVRGLGADAERRCLACRVRRGGRSAARAVRGVQAAPGRRFRTARLPGLRHEGGAARQADPRRAGEARLEPRGGHAQGRFRPVGQCKMSAGLDDKGDLVGLAMRISAQSILATWRPAAHGRTARTHRFPGPQPAGAPKASSATPSRTSWSSTPCATRTCRRASGAASTTTRTRSGSSASSTSWRRRPARTRLSSARKLMANHPKHLAVLNAVADKIGWARRKPPAGAIRGIAQIMGYGSYVAAVAEVSVERTRQGQGASPGARHRLRPRRQPGPGRRAGRRVCRLRSRRHAATRRRRSRMAASSRRTSTATRSCCMDEFPKSRDGDGAFRRLLGRRGRADDLRGGAGRAERHLAATGKPVRTLPLKNVKLV